MIKKLAALPLIASMLLSFAMPLMARAHDEDSSPTKSMTLRMNALNASRETGKAYLSEHDGKVTVTLTLSGEPANASQPAHIHLGTCKAPSDVKWPLSNVVNGKSVTALDVSMEKMLESMPLMINVHKSAEESSVYVSCGDIKKELMRRHVLDGQCMANAVEKRDTAVTKALSDKNTALLASLESRRAELKAAWMLPTSRERAKALAAAWKKWLTDSRKTTKDFRTAKSAAWKQYRLERKDCGPGSTSEGEIENNDSQL